MAHKGISNRIGYLAVRRDMQRHWTWDELQRTISHWRMMLSYMQCDDERATTLAVSIALARHALKRRDRMGEVVRRARKGLRRSCPRASKLGSPTTPSNELSSSSDGI
jgi:hypothetical protein